MPVLNPDQQAKRFIMPSTKENAEQGWIEMMTYPLCSDDYSEYYTALYAYQQLVEANKAEGLKPPIVQQYIIARRIVDWNYTDKDKVKLPINANTVKFLPLQDSGFIMDQIEREQLEDMPDPKDESSSAPSLPASEVSQ